MYLRSFLTVLEHQYPYDWVEYPRSYLSIDLTGEPTIANEISPFLYYLLQVIKAY